MQKRHSFGLLIAVASVPLAACGGGGGETKVATIPPPPAPPPPPQSAPPVKIFAVPTAGDYASVGASIEGPGGNLDTYVAPTSFGPISAADQDQAHVRYTSAGYYELQLPGSSFDRLVHYRGLVNPPANNNYFEPQSAQMNRAFLVTRNSRDQGYAYSELGSWGSQAAARWGYVAFGTPTPAGGVPLTGAASFNGVVSGSSDIMLPDNLYGGYYALPVDGTVALNFDFGAGSLSGSMSLSLPDGMQPMPIGTFAFRNTVFGAGSTTYSGSFDTTALGQNFFLGRFTGPNAQETIGAWAIPFVFNRDGTYIHGDGQTHQAFGAWIAKRGN